VVVDGWRLRRRWRVERRTGEAGAAGLGAAGSDAVGARRDRGMETHLVDLGAAAGGRRAFTSVTEPQLTEFGLGSPSQVHAHAGSQEPARGSIVLGQ
jgi:hypothetical protein